MIDPTHGWNASYKPQYIGFVLSLALLVAAYRFAMLHEFSSTFLVITLLGIAIIQAVVQFIFFMHIGLESKPHWNTITLLFTVLVIFIVIGGSVWIMSNLNYNLMPDMGMGH